MSIFGNETSKSANTQLSATDYAKALANGSLLDELTLGSAFVVGGNNSSAGGAGTAAGAGSTAGTSGASVWLIGGIVVIASLGLWLFRKR